MIDDHERWIHLSRLFETGGDPVTVAREIVTACQLASSCTADADARVIVDHAADGIDWYVHTFVTTNNPTAIEGVTSAMVQIAEASSMVLGSSFARLDMHRKMRLMGAFGPHGLSPVVWQQVALPFLERMSKEAPDDFLEFLLSQVPELGCGAAAIQQRILPLLRHIAQTRPGLAEVAEDVERTVSKTT